MMGAVHGYLAAHAPSWTVLRPSWFMENFSEQQHRVSIVEENAIFSATGNGRVAFVSADDIAAVAAAVLTDPETPNGEMVLTGPSALSYDDVAQIISEVVGRRIVHRKLPVDALAERFRQLGLPADYAHTLANMDGLLASGAEDRTTGVVSSVLGRLAIPFERYAQSAKGAWM